MSSTPKNIVYIAMSLDGFIAGPEGQLDWLDAYSGGSEDYGYHDFMASVDALVMGRKTHDMVRSFGEWPYGDKRVIVMTRSPDTMTAVAKEEFYAGSPAELTAKLKNEGCKRAYIDGGRLIRAFLKEGLMHEMIISIAPILLGKGIPLFGEDVSMTNLELLDSRKYESGFAQVHYAVKQE